MWRLRSVMGEIRLPVAVKFTKTVHGTKMYNPIISIFSVLYIRLVGRWVEQTLLYSWGSPSSHDISRLLLFVQFLFYFMAIEFELVGEWIRLLHSYSVHGLFHVCCVSENLPKEDVLQRSSLSDIPLPGGGLRRSHTSDVITPHPPPIKGILRESSFSGSMASSGKGSSVRFNTLHGKPSSSSNQLRVMTCHNFWRV